MSSLAAAQADGYYVPVEYYESGAYKKKSKNQWNDHQEGKKKPEGPPVVRFELPYTGTCVGCGHFILRGTRYNATKKKAGLYLTSPIWEFQVKCRNCCKQIFTLRTNPKEQSFDYVSGITKQQRHLEPAPTAEEGDSSEEERAALGQLETMARGQRKVMSEVEQLEALQKNSTTLYFNDASRNAQVRTKFRGERKDRKRRRKDAEALGYREGISILAPTVEDEVQAKEVTFGDRRAKERKSFGKARASSIFNSSKKTLKQSTAKRRKRRKESTTVQPDRITSSKTPNSDAPKKKKILVIGLANAAATTTTTTTKEPKSGLSALVDYGSDSS